MKRALILMAVAVGLALGARAQSISQTVSLTVTPGDVSVSGNFNNVGQSAHQLYACISGASVTSSATIELEASSDDTHYFAISLPLQLNYNPAARTQQGSCGVISGNGYYAAVQLQVSGVTGTGSYQIVGTYSGSVGTSPIGGEARSASASAKVTLSSFENSYTNTALKSTPAALFTAATLPASLSVFVYGVLVSNPNSSVVYVSLIDTNVTGNQPQILIPVPATGTVNLILPDPAFMPASNGSLGPYVSCSTSPSSAVDPTTGCVVNVLMENVSGANSQVEASGTVVQTDNSGGNTPY